MTTNTQQKQKAEEYAEEVYRKDTHFPHPNFKRFIIEAFMAGVEYKELEIAERHRQQFDNYNY